MSKLYKSAGEDLQEIPLTIGPTNYTWYPLYHIIIPVISIKSIASLIGQAQVETDLPYNVQFVSYLTASASPIAVTGTTIEPVGLFPSLPSGSDFYTEQHYDRINVGAFVDEAMLNAMGLSFAKGVVFTLIGEAASDAAKIGDALLLKQGYGGLSARIGR